VPPPSADSKGDSADKSQDKPAKSTAGAAADAAKADAKTTSATPAKSADASSIMVRIVPGITRYHKEDCLLIRFLAAEDLEVMSLKSAAEEGYFACKACKPDQTADDTAS
jgi:hypothetical protein